jgi:hypothetical protein
MNEFLEETDELGAQLRRLPTPMPPAALVERVRRLAQLELAGHADEKMNRLLLAFLLGFSWTVGLTGFFALRIFAAGALSVLNFTTLEGPLGSLGLPVVYFTGVWVTGAALFVVLGLRYRRKRRIA